MIQLPDGLLAVVKRECPTCNLVVPVLSELAAREQPLTVFSQDDPSFPEGVRQRVDDTALEASYQLGVHIVPTLIRSRDGREVSRAIGWDRDEWESISGLSDLGRGLPPSRPGCGSRTDEPGMAERLAVRYGDVRFQSRRVHLPSSTDAIEAC